MYVITYIIDMQLATYFCIQQSKASIIGNATYLYFSLLYYPSGIETMVQL